MNIFEIFALGDGRVNEPNMSSVLAFLLTPEASHGYGRTFLGDFLDCLKGEIKQTPLWESIKPRDNSDSMRYAVEAFSDVRIDLEVPLAAPDSSNRKSRELDICIELEFDEKLALIIAIENKIKDNSAGDADQLKDEYEYLRNIKEKDIPIIFVYLTPNPKEYSGASIHQQWKNLENHLYKEKKTDENCLDAIKNISWDNSKNDNGKIESENESIRQISLKLLRDEAEAKINPPSSHAGLLMRSMIKFIDNDFGLANFQFGSTRNDAELRNQMRIVSEEEFWDWEPDREETKAKARESLDIAKNYFAKQGRLSRLVFKYRFTTSRITLFLDYIENPTPLDRKRVPNTIFRINKGYRTGDTQLHLDLELAAEVTVQEIITERLRNRLKYGASRDRQFHDLFIPSNISNDDFKEVMDSILNETTSPIINALEQNS